MIRARLSDGSFILGVDAENIRRLTEGQALVVDLAALGGTDKVFIMYGTTMADILRELEQATGEPLPIPSPLPSGTPQ